MPNVPEEVLRFYFQNAGTGFEHGRWRVFCFCRDAGPSEEQLAVFLKKEYGIGGAHPACTLDREREEYISDDHDSRGLRLRQYKWSYDPETDRWPTHTIAETTLTWRQAAQYILELVRADEYLRIQDLAYFEYYRLRKAVLGAA